MQDCRVMNSLRSYVRINLQNKNPYATKGSSNGLRRSPEIRHQLKPSEASTREVAPELLRRNQPSVIPA